MRLISETMTRAALQMVCGGGRGRERETDRLLGSLLARVTVEVIKETLGQLIFFIIRRCSLMRGTNNIEEHAMVHIGIKSL